ncbi:gas vesicle protein GvpA/GvpJ/GvpM family [Micromonospora olivasterospora]|uniref:Gas vesicle protein GvpA/GvpJ/GvpM family n=1 Tax=Micromonospora olivasterospora TaxID=1880 RepID=A0A562IDL0_MICOL|nr:gas vesicle protein GvpA/GvpJ/GvpM family [Micromonospora olivasterospora]
MQPQRSREGTLVHVVETLLDRGLVLNADIMVSVAGVELLGIRIRAALASFETAARYGLEFPAGTNIDTRAGREALESNETCLGCGKRVPTQELLERSCPWCGWRSARSLALEKSQGEIEAGSTDRREPAGQASAQPAQEVRPDA